MKLKGPTGCGLKLPPAALGDLSLPSEAQPSWLSHQGCGGKLSSAQDCSSYHRAKDTPLGPLTLDPQALSSTDPVGWNISFRLKRYF